MTGHADWVLGLSADGEVPESSCPDLVAEAAKSLGAGPAGWAVLTAARMTEEIVEKVPEHGGGAAQVDVLRRAVEASILLGLRGLMQDTPPTDDGIAAAAVEGAADLARRGVPLDAVLRGVRIGHAFLHRALTDVVDREPEAIRTGEAHRLSELLFAYADVQASRVAEEYLAERSRAAGRPGGHPPAGCRRTSRGPTDRIVGSLTHPRLSRGRLPSRVRALARQPAVWVHRRAPVLRRTGPGVRRRPFLVLPGDSGELWAWAGWKSRPPDTLVADLKARLTAPDGVGVSIGPAERGPTGMRRSLRWARECRRVAAVLRPGWLCDYTEVWTLSLITSDLERARWYAEETLGALLAPGERIRVLRETLRVYLGCGQSGREAARRLFIARNTVQYRLQRAEETIGRPVAQDPMRLWLALEIARLVPPGDEEDTRAAR